MRPAKRPRSLMSRPDEDCDAKAEDPAPALWAFGNSAEGQLGHGRRENFPSPEAVGSLKGVQTSFLACGERMSAVVTEGGAVLSTGLNDQRELGRDGRPSVYAEVDALVAVSVNSVALGNHFGAAVAQDGRLFTWGANDEGQLASGDREPSGKTRRAAGARDRIVRQVAAGFCHAIALDDLGDVLAWGSARFGQLADGTFVSSHTPSPVPPLRGRPIIHVAAGGDYSLALTANGVLYSWGNNHFGQLGHGDTQHRLRPTPVQALRTAFVSRVAAGAHHTVVATAQGILFGCGANANGQLGLGDDAKGPPVPSPTVIEALREQHAVYVACGARHTVVACNGGRRRCFAFGLNGSGQLGMGDFTDRARPVEIEPMRGRLIAAVACGAHHTVIAVGEGAARAVQVSEAGRRVATLDAEGLQQLIRAANAAVQRDARALDSGNEVEVGQLRRQIEATFQSPSVLNASFLRPWSPGQTVASLRRETRLDVAAVQEAFTQLVSLRSEAVLRTLGRATLQLSSQLASVPADSPESLNVFLIAFLNPILLSPAQHHVTVGRIIDAFLGLPREARDIVVGWTRGLHSEYFSTILGVLQAYVTYAEEHLRPGRDAAPAVMLLKELFHVNERHCIVPPTLFWNSALSQRTDLEREFVKWLESGRDTKVFNLVNYCFVLDAQAKRMLLLYEASLHMRQQMARADQARLMSMLSETFFPPELVSRAFVLRVRRDSIVADSMLQLTQTLSSNPAELKKPLMVQFTGEDGVDEGGVRKDYFHTMAQHLLDPELGVFRELEETNFLWFSGAPLSAPLPQVSVSVEELTGVLLGLALYNGVMMDVHFAPVLYDMLLGRSPERRHLEQAMPTVAASLDQLLRYDGNVEEDLSLTFEVISVTPEEEKHELVPDGANQPVTEHNREEFARLYTRYLLYDSVKQQLEAFMRGFTNAIGRFALDVCTAQELELLLVGNPELGNFDELKKVAQYSGGFTADHSVVKWFWEVADELSEKDKKRLLFFATGSDRVPLRGLGSLRFVLHRMQTSPDHLPVAHTCYNIVELPEYRDSDELRTRLMKALDYAETGFGLA